MCKTIIMVWACLAVASPYAFALDHNGSSREKHGKEIVQQVESILSMINIQSEQIMTVSRKNGTTRQYRLNVFTDNGDKAFAEIMGPAREKRGYKC